ncbi:MAG TPA: enoyl-CoA hydratase/isomerase family protein [Acidimicrobiia bacterium]|nr:enoyl-CoA hydratase/isomerase family protein [Acidimicrobiia bacterium]
MTTADFDQLADEELVSDLTDGVLRLTINRAAKGNSIPWYVRDRLMTHFLAAHTNLAVRCVVLTAVGERHFCTGADLTVAHPMVERPEGAPDRPVGVAADMMRRGFERLMETILDCQKPVIVALNGTAAGGGSMLTLAADLVIAADSARIIQVFVRRGLVPDGGVTYLLPRLVGMHKAKELMFFGDDLSAADAERLGIVNKVVAGADLAAATDEWAQRLANGPTKAIGWSKQLLNLAFDVPRAQHLETEALLVETNGGTFDSTEGVAAFRERREPEWQGW